MSEEKKVEAAQVPAEPDESKDNILMTELNRGWRKVEGTPWGDIRIYTDTFPIVQRKADEVHAKTKGRMLSNKDFKTHKQLLGMYEERGEWSAEQEQEFFNKQYALAEFTDDLKSKKDKAREKHLEELREMQRQFFDLTYQRTVLFNASIETQSDVERRLILILRAVRKDPGDDKKTYQECDPVWKDIDALLTDNDFRFIQGRCAIFWSRLEAGDDFLGELLEDLTLKPDGDTAKIPDSPSLSKEKPAQS